MGSSLLFALVYRLSEPSFRGETGGLSSRTLHVILRFLLTWPFKVCMTTDLCDSCCLNTAPSAFKSGIETQSAGDSSLLTLFSSDVIIVRGL